MGVVVPLGGNSSSSEAAVERLTALVRTDMAQVDALIADRMRSSVDLIPEVSTYLVQSGGKRLRPMLTLASAKMCGYDGVHHAKLAAAVEFIHTATLLHDDVVDESRMRRGKPSANTVWGNQVVVLVGDFLFSRAFQLMVQAEDLRVLDVLSQAAAVIAEGEVMQLLAQKNMKTTEEAYLRVIGAKTAALFAAACQVGGMVAARPDEEIEALESFGRNLGLAFQLVDDALDYMGEEAALGKTVGDDFREGKITLPIVLAYRRGSEDERSFWRKAIEGGDPSQDDLRHAVALMNRHDTIADTIARAGHYGAIAKDALAIFPESDYRAALTAVVDFCINRSH